MKLLHLTEDISINPFEITYILRGTPILNDNKKPTSTTKIIFKNGDSLLVSISFREALALIEDFKIINDLDD